jgi:hypothetical protein
MSSLTPVKDNSSDSETIQTTAQHTSTGEPTPGTILDSKFVHPQTGYCWQAPFGKEKIVPGGGRLGLRLVSPAAGADAFARMHYAE